MYQKHTSNKFRLLLNLLLVAISLLVISILVSLFIDETTKNVIEPEQIVKETASEKPTKESIITELNKKLGKYAVSVTLSPPNNETSYSTWSELTDVNVDALNEFATYLAVEFTKYPVDLVMNSELKTIGIVRDLKVAGTSRASVPVPALNTMVYDAEQQVRGGKDYASSGISHEYWHFLDYKMRADYRYFDQDWSLCNPPGFSYGNGGETAYGNPDFTNAFYDRKGFVTEYSTYGIEEDRAEMFGWLMYMPERVRNLNDTGINCKITRLNELVKPLSSTLRF